MCPGSAPCRTSLHPPLARQRDLLQARYAPTMHYEKKSCWRVFIKRQQLF